MSILLLKINDYEHSTILWYISSQGSTSCLKYRCLQGTHEKICYHYDSMKRNKQFFPLLMLGSFKKEEKMSLDPYDNTYRFKAQWFANIKI